MEGCKNKIEYEIKAIKLNSTILSITEDFIQIEPIGQHLSLRFSNETKEYGLVMHLMSVEDAERRDKKLEMFIGARLIALELAWNHELIYAAQLEALTKEFSLEGDMTEVTDEEKKILEDMEYAEKARSILRKA